MFSIKDLNILKSWVPQILPVADTLMRAFLYTFKNSQIDKSTAPICRLRISKVKKKKQRLTSSDPGFVKSKVICYFLKEIRQAYTDFRTVICHTLKYRQNRTIHRTL